MRPALAGGSPGKGLAVAASPADPSWWLLGMEQRHSPIPTVVVPPPGSPSTRLQGGLGRCIMQEMRKELWAGSGTARTC